MSNVHLKINNLILLLYLFVFGSVFIVFSSNIIETSHLRIEIFVLFIKKFNKLEIFLHSNCALNESLIADLRKKLTSTENNLTDIRLEALSSVHQVDQLKEYLEKLKIDMMSLKSENQLLKKHIRETKCQKISLAKNRIISDFDTNESFLDYLSTNEDTTSMFNNDDSQDSSVTNLNNNYFYSYNFLLDDENENLLRKVLVTIECGYQFMPNQSTSENKNFIYELCTINIDSKLKWHLMDGIVTYVFKRYLNRIDATRSLGLDKNSIDKYFVGDMVRKVADSKLPDMLPFGYLVGNNCKIKIILKGEFNFKLNLIWV